MVACGGNPRQIMLVSRIRISFASACGSPCLGRDRSIDTPALSRSISEGPSKIDRPPEIGWLVGSLLAMQVKTPGK